MTPAETLVAIARERLQLVTVPGGFVVRDSEGRALQYPDGRQSEPDISKAVEDALAERSRRTSVIEERSAALLLREFDRGHHVRPRRVAVPAVDGGGDRITWGVYDVDGVEISAGHGSAREALLSLKSGEAGGAR